MPTNPLNVAVCLDEGRGYAKHENLTVAFKVGSMRSRDCYRIGWGRADCCYKRRRTQRRVGTRVRRSDSRARHAPTDEPDSQARAGNNRDGLGRLGGPCKRDRGSDQHHGERRYGVVVPDPLPFRYFHAECECDQLGRPRCCCKLDGHQAWNQQIVRRLQLRRNGRCHHRPSRLLRPVVIRFIAGRGARSGWSRWSCWRDGSCWC